MIGRFVLGRGLFLVGYEALFDPRCFADQDVVFLRHGNVALGDQVVVSKDGHQTYFVFLFKFIFS